MDKQWYLSRTIWGVIIGFVALVLANFGYTISSEQGTEIVNNIVALCQAVAGLVGIILVIYGRIKAGRKIETLKANITSLKTETTRLVIEKQALKRRNARS